MNKEAKELLNQNFSQAANSLTWLFKVSLSIQEDCYKKGQVEAYKDIIDFCLKSTGGDLRKVSTYDMINFLKQKIKENTKPEKDAAQQNYNETTDKKDQSNQYFNNGAQPLFSPSQDSILPPKQEKVLRNNPLLILEEKSNESANNPSTLFQFQKYNYNRFSASDKMYSVINSNGAHDRSSDFYKMNNESASPFGGKPASFQANK